MSDPEKLDHEAGARFIEKLMTADPASLDVATDEEVDAMMERAGIEVGEPETAEQVLARGLRRAKERQERARERRASAVGEADTASKPAAPGAHVARKRALSRRAWVAAGVVAAAAAAVVAVEIAESRRGPEAIGPEPPSPAP